MLRCRVLRWARRHAGRRGGFLLITGTGQVCWGAGIVTDPPSTAGLRLLTDRCPIEAWGWLWVVCGAVAMVSAFVRVGRDGAGFIAVYLPPVTWATAYAAAAVTGEFSRGVWVAGWYLTAVGVIMWAATVPEYAVPRTKGPQRGEAP